MKQAQKYTLLSKQDCDALPKNDGFWYSAATYSSKMGRDAPFASEMAYMIVTLYRSGA